MGKKELKKIADAFFDNDERVLRSCGNGEEKGFLDFLRSEEISFEEKSKFELKGFAVSVAFQPPIGSEIHKNLLVNKFFNKRDKVKQYTMTIALSYRCSFKCEQCYISEYRDPLRKEMSVNEFKTVFKKAVEAADVWHFDITGGEPFEHPDFFRIIKQIPPDKATAIVATNGLLIDKKMISRIKQSNIMVCKVSVDPYAGPNYSSMRRSLHSIKALTDNKVLAFAQIYIKRGFSESFDLKSIIGECRKAGAVIVNLIRPMAIGNLRDREELFISDKERGILFSLEKYYWLMHGYRIGMFPDWELVKGGCEAARGRIYINPYGDIYPCNFFPKRYGNILTDDLTGVIVKMQKDIGKRPMSCPATNSSFGELRKFIVEKD